MKVIDCAAKLNERMIENLKQAGIGAVGRYLGDAGSWKSMGPSEAESILKAGLSIFSIWETAPTERAYFSARQGMRDAEAACRYARSIGQPQGTPIYFTVDYNAGTGDLEAIMAYFRAVKDAEKGYSAGVYGSFRVVEALGRTGLADFFFQTYAWSDGNLSAYAHLYQFQNDRPVAGIRVDFDKIIKSGGTWKRAAQPAGAKAVSPLLPKSAGYTVKSGDTLSAIGVRSGLDYRLIKKWNGLTSDTIYPGQKLKLYRPAGSSMNTFPYPGRPLRRGSTGQDVVLVQKAVGARSDGIFGPRTEAAVKAFQLGRALVPDGIVGPRTWNLLF
ncbi:DUF1906 domain-containing protein [Sporolactobacillus sp. CQH2019]|uniref:glycoside hydrolase domain-containing protein n=1 Tax=Sporolactobacillus sp. CQH2019 TaxID=3023512 RepID=UPI002367E08C|nr:glycoside hydrolase domain-containing protein [Sporolactobacillus sp. CQH2019]MDD9149027.1 DUF1906 domain-containing protein [Sporolactobacillus sp. CQH2019]